MIITQDTSEGIYFDGEGKFIAEILGKDIMKRIPLLTTKDNETVYFYDMQEGIWLPNGDVIIKEMATKMLGQDSTRHRVEEALFHIKAKTYRDRKIFDMALNLIPLQNGILDIVNLQFFDYTPDYYFLSKIPVKFNPDARCPNIEKFLSEIVIGKDTELLLEITGYCLLRDYRIQKAVMLVGEGENGKSTWLNLLIKFLGSENVSTVSLQDLGSNRFAISNLYGKLANIHADLSNMELKATGKFKQLTGSDLIQGEQKFKAPFNFLNHAKLIFSCNRLPIANDTTNAFYRRWIIITFPNSFEGIADKTILTKITTEEELSGFLNLIIDRIRKLMDTGQFSRNESTEDLRERYIRLADSVAAFVMDSIEISIDGYETKETLYSEYAEYCRLNNYPLIPKAKFFKDLYQHVRLEDYRPSIDGLRVQCLKGIQLKNKEAVNDVNHISNFNTLEKYTH